MMARPSEQEITEALISHCTVENGSWYFESGASGHSEEEARMIVEACLILDTRVTDLMSSKMWHSMIVRLTHVEEMVEEIYEQEVRA